MCFFGSLIPATVFVTWSYLIWFAAGFAEGNRHKWGNLLAAWLFVVALGFIACGAYMAVSGNCPMEKLFSDDTAQ